MHLNISLFVPEVFYVQLGMGEIVCFFGEKVAFQSTFFLTKIDCF
jgi:hypothetical protein